jgi:hypothetical protein
MKILSVSHLEVTVTNESDILDKVKGKVTFENIYYHSFQTLISLCVYILMA